MLSLYAKRKIIHAVVLVFCLISFSEVLKRTEQVEILERKTIDLRTRITRMNKSIPSDIVIILIDDASLASMSNVVGRWPWPRYVHADLIDFLKNCGAKQIVLDILFTEYQVEQFNKKEIGFSDKRLCESTALAGNVLNSFQIVVDYQDEANSSLLNKKMPDDFAEKFSVKKIGSEENNNSREPSVLNNFYLPIRELYRGSKGVGVVSYNPDSDGVFRSEKLIFDYQGNFYPSLGLLPFITSLKDESVALDKGFLKIKSGEMLYKIPLNHVNSYYPNMYGIYNSFSYSGVIQTMMALSEGKTEDLIVTPKEFKDKIVFIGASAASVGDTKITSVSNYTPGVFLHASVFGNIIDNDYLSFCSNFVDIIPLFILIVITVFSILFFKRILLNVFYPLSALTVYCLISVLLFRKNLVIDTALPAIGLFTAYIVSFIYIGFTEGKEKRKVKHILGQYVSPSILSTVLEDNPEEFLKAEVGKKEYLTIFFSDIRGFTTISEKFPVETVVKVLNNYLSDMVNIIFENKGTLDKFIGDAVVAFWGAPVKFENHPYLAVLSAVQMIEAVKQLNLKMPENMPRLKIGIGIHTGSVILGNIGSEKKLDYTVIGDTVNLTSRLEGLTKQYGSNIIISEETFLKVQEHICARKTDFVKVKGKDKPILIYDVQGLKDSIKPEINELTIRTDTAFDLYSNRKFGAALEIYLSLLEDNPDDVLACLFAERCRQFVLTPPEEDWDGSYVFTTK